MTIPLTTHESTKAVIPALVSTRVNSSGNPCDATRGCSGGLSVIPVKAGIQSYAAILIMVKWIRGRYGD